MPGYNPWDAFSQGMGIGEDMRQSANRRRLGEAYSEAEAQQPGSGMGAVERTAYGQGDMRTGMATRQFQNEQEEDVYNRMRRARNFVVPAIQRSLQYEPEQARAFLTQPHFMQRYGANGLGLDDATIERGMAELSNPDPAVRQAAADRIITEFQGLDAPDWSLQTMPAEGGGYEQRAIGVGPDGYIQQGPNAIPSAGSGFRPATPQERADNQVPAGVTAQVEIATNRLYRSGSPPGARSSGAQYARPEDNPEFEGFLE